MLYKVGDKVVVCGNAPGIVVRDTLIGGYLVQLENQHREDGHPRIVKCYAEHLMPDTPAGRVLFGSPKSKFFKKSNNSLYKLSTFKGYPLLAYTIQRIIGSIVNFKVKAK